MSCLHTMSGVKIPPFLNYVLCLRHNIPYLYTCILAFFIYNVICNYAWYVVKIFWIWYCIEYSAFWRHAAMEVERNISGNGHATQIGLFINSFFIKWLVCSWWRCLSTSSGSTTTCKPRTNDGWLHGWLVWTWHSWWYVWQPTWWRSQCRCSTSSTYCPGTMAMARGGGTCSNTYFSRCKVMSFSSHTRVVKHPSKTQGKQYYVVRHFLVLS